MCACKPGSTCTYHTYALWPQTRKDAWNARRRESYAAKRLQRYGDEPYETEDPHGEVEAPISLSERAARLNLRDRAVLRGYKGQSLDQLNEVERRELFALTKRAGYPSVKSLKADEWRERLLALKDETGQWD